MQRRADLIPNLVQTVKGYAKQEKQIFIQVAEARAKLAGAKTIPEKIAANQQIDGVLSRLLVIVERYPELKSNQNFMALQDEWRAPKIELRWKGCRFNQTVPNYNVLVRQFPGSLFAGFFGFAPKEIYFQAAEGAKTVPKVEFLDLVNI